MTRLWFEWRLCRACEDGASVLKRDPWHGQSHARRSPVHRPHRRYPRHLFALGYGGNGMTFGLLASRLLLESYRGDRSDDHALSR